VISDISIGSHGMNYCLATVKCLQHDLKTRAVGVWSLGVMVWSDTLSELIVVS